MTTVLVHSTYLDHPVQEQMKRWTELPAAHSSHDAGSHGISVGMQNV